MIESHTENQRKIAESGSSVKKSALLKALDHTKCLLDEINQMISTYDPLLREKARDILLARAFGLAIISDMSTGTIDPTSFAPQQDDPTRLDLKSLFDAWSPKTHRDRALLSAYYLQTVRGFRNLKGRQIQERFMLLLSMGFTCGTFCSKD